MNPNRHETYRWYAKFRKDDFRSEARTTCGGPELRQSVYRSFAFLTGRNA
jgi:hypothetical protein